MFWNVYKNRMGISADTAMVFNLQDLVPRRENLEHLSEPFSREEVDAVVKKLPNDKSPEPDGFNGLFIKKCWYIIKEDFYTLIKEFQEGSLSIQALTNSFIILIMKKNNPESTNDFRPISLLNTAVELITKLLANRLQIRIKDLVHTNQYGFIRGRAI